MKFNFKKTLPVLAGFFFSGLAMAQAPAIQWQKSLGGLNTEEANDIIQTIDGGYLIAGNADSNTGQITGNHGYMDYWLVKLNSAGTMQWQRSFGGSADDTASSVIQTTDGGFAVAGTSYSNNGDVTGNHGNSDIWITKLNSDAGVIEWQKSLGGTWYESARKIIQTADGGYIVSGSSNSNNGDVTGNHGTFDFWIVKLSSTGNIQWQKSFGGSGEDIASSIIQTADGNYVVAGSSTSNDGNVTGNHGWRDFWILKLNSDGGVIFWQKSFGGSHVEVLNSMITTSDGGYILAGSAYSDDGDITGSMGGTDYWIVKLNSTGNLQWQKSLGGTKVDIASSILQTSDGGYMVVGSSNSNDGQVTGYHPPLATGPGEGPNYYDYWAVKLNSTGNIQWQKALGGSGIDNANSVIQTADGGFIIAGDSTSNNGDITGNQGGKDYWVVKLAPENLATSEVVKDDAVTAKVFPNPAKDHVTLKLDYFTPSMEASIIDMLGKTVHQQKLDGLKTKINTTHLGKGVYFMNVSGSTQKITQKLIIE